MIFKRRNNRKLNLHAKKTAGFTLLEMIIVVGVFGILVAASVEIFITLYDVGQKTNISRSLTQDLRQSLETISREARSAQKLNSSSGEDTIELTTASGYNLKFFCEDDSGNKCSIDNPGSIRLEKTDNLGVALDPVTVTSKDSLITLFDISEQSVNETSENQPLVKITVSAESIHQDRAGANPKVTLQTVASKTIYSDTTYCDLFSCDSSKPKVLSCLTDTSQTSGHMVVLNNFGRLFSAGGNSVGQLGLGHTITETRFKKARLKSIKDASCGFASGLGFVTLAITNDGKMKAVGNNRFLAGTGGTTPGSIWAQAGRTEDSGYITDAISVSTSNYNTHVIRGSNREIWASGEESFGAMGIRGYDSGRRHSYFKRGIKDDNQPIINALQVDSAQNHAIALLGDGTVWITGCMRVVSEGRCGTSGGDTWKQVTELIGEDIVKVRAGRVNSFAVTRDGKLWWVGSGNNTWRKDANSSDVYDVQPASASGSTVVAVMIKNDGSYYRTNWLGGSNINWTQDTSISNVSQISKHYYSSMISLLDGSIKTIGGNNAGELGIGTLGGIYTTWQTPGLNLRINY